MRPFNRIFIVTLGLLLIYAPLAYAQVEVPFNWAEQALTLLFALVATLYAVHTRQYKQDMHNVSSMIREIKQDNRELAREVHTLAISMVGMRTELNQIQKGATHE